MRLGTFRWTGAHALNRSQARQASCVQDFESLATAGTCVTRQFFGRQQARRNLVSEAFAYLPLFLISLGAATILPLQSEMVVVGLLVGGHHPWELIVLVASLGNTAGSAINWLLGRSIASLQHRRWFPASQRSMRWAEDWYRRVGRSSLLLSWIPIVGDPLTTIAGALREPLLSFVLLVGLAKMGRYLVVTALTLYWFP